MDDAAALRRVDAVLDFEDMVLLGRLRNARQAGVFCHLESSCSFIVWR